MIEFLLWRPRKLLAQPSSSNDSDFPNIPRELYEEWTHAEARLDVFRDLHVTCFIFEVAREDALVKARESQLACCYDPAMPRPGSRGG